MPEVHLIGDVLQPQAPVAGHGDVIVDPAAGALAAGLGDVRQDGSIPGWVGRQPGDLAAITLSHLSQQPSQKRRWVPLQEPASSAT